MSVSPVPAGINERTIIDHRNLANNEHSFPDVFFVIDEKSQVLGHSFILTERLPQLFEDGAALKKKKKKNNKTKKEIITLELNKGDQITLEAVQRVLVYAYCGQIDYRLFNPFKAVEVMRAASVFKIDRLNQMTQKYLQSSLTIDNIFKLLKFTDTMMVDTAKKICMEFALGNADFFTSASAESLGFKLYQEVTALMLKAHQGQKNPTAAEIQVTADDTIVEDFKRIYASNSSKDVSFIIQGEDVKAHKAILIDQSTEFAALVNGTLDDGKDPKDTPKRVPGGPVYLDEKYANISPGAIEAMFRLFYYAEQEMEVLHACQLFVFARDFNLVRLSMVIEKIISSGEVTATTALALLDVAYNPLMAENPLQKRLKDGGMKFVIQNVDKIDFLPLQNMSPLIGTQILQQLQQVLAPNWRSMVLSSPRSNGSESPRKFAVTAPSVPNDYRRKKAKSSKEVPASSVISSTVTSTTKKKK